MNPKLGALQSTQIEFIYCVTSFWEAAPKVSDVILPVATLGEVDDIINWENYSVYLHTLSPPVGESMSDFNIYVALATKLGFANTLTSGQTADQWLQSLYASAKYSMAFSDFKNAGYIKYSFDTTPAITPPFSNFLADPVANKLGTTSGLFEIYSQAVAKYFGDNTPNAPPIPKVHPRTGEPSDSDFTVSDSAHEHPPQVWSALPVAEPHVVARRSSDVHKRLPNHVHQPRRCSGSEHYQWDCRESLQFSRTDTRSSIPYDQDETKHNQRSRRRMVHTTAAGCCEHNCIWEATSTR